jgi:flagellar basal-body rod protein FlgB
VEPIHLFDLASRQARWASVRQATISGNIANADTPGYHARDIVPFTAVLQKTALTLARTEPGHLDVSGSGVEANKIANADSWDITHSGNTVSLDQELLKAGEVSRAYTLNTNIVRSFHKMLLSSVRSGT